MTDVFSPEKRSEVMARIRSRGNRETELALLKILRRNQISGWRRHLPVIGNPDFVFRKESLLIFVDGCFWHGCPRCYRRPRSKRTYWDAKLKRNRQRDREVTKTLKARGWKVVRIWEHQLKREKLIVNRLRKIFG